MGLSSVFNTADHRLAGQRNDDRRRGQQRRQLEHDRLQGVGSVVLDAVLADAQLGFGADGDERRYEPAADRSWVRRSRAIRPVFTQGTIAISSNPSDLALQGDGFFIVQSTAGEQLYTRNGKFELNSQSELVTAGGERLLGFGVDDNFQIQPTTLHAADDSARFGGRRQGDGKRLLARNADPTGDSWPTSARSSNRASSATARRACRPICRPTRSTP